MNQYHLDLYLENLFDQNICIDQSQWQDWLTKWFNHLNLDFDKNKTYDINLRLTNDQEIQSLNKLFRQQDKPTDVLSFAALEDNFPDVYEIESIALGDIIISVETASKQANLENHSLEIELAWLASHGLLHLLGWDHPDDDSLKQMLTMQGELLNSVSVNAPSIKKYFS